MMTYRSDSMNEDEFYEMPLCLNQAQRHRFFFIQNVYGKAIIHVYKDGIVIERPTEVEDIEF